MTYRHTFPAAFLFFVCTSLFSLKKEIPPPADLRALVQEAVNKAVQEEEQQTTFYQYRLRKETLSYEVERDMVELKSGIVARTHQWKDRELTPEERVNDEERINKLLTDEDERKRVFKGQKEEADRIMRLVKALPDGLLYTFDGNETLNDKETYRLKFKPNPRFSPTSRETIVYKSTEGSLWIDASEHTIVKLEGTLMDDINIGWGILGHINKGGKVELEQSEVSPGHWRITRLISEAKGRAFLFKSIEIWQHQYATKFKLVPDSLTLQEAIKLLRSEPGTSTTK